MRKRRKVKKVVARPPKAEEVMKTRLVTSFIDWNEVVPLLPKQLQETLYLEVIPMLMVGGEAPYTKNKIIRKQYRVGKGNGVLPKRLWKGDHPNELLARSGRKFKINKDRKIKGPTIGSKAGKMWEKLKESKGDIITIEGLYSLAKGFDLDGASVVSHFWSDRRLDIVEDAATQS